MKLNITTKMILLNISVVLLCFSAIISFVYYQSHKYFIQSSDRKKSYEAQVIKNQILSKIEEMQNDALFLASTPPIDGMKRAIKTGFDNEGSSSLNQWKERLSVIFKEMLHAKKDYTQIRFIGYANNGKEVVRVDRKYGKVIREIEDNLQQKGSEKYFKDAFKIGFNSIYLSEFSLNRERGKVEYPKNIVIRSAMPIYIDHKTPFGLLIINTSYKTIFRNLLNLIDDNEDIIITDKYGSILLDSSNNLKTQQNEIFNIKDIYSELHAVTTELTARPNFHKIDMGNKEAFYLSKKIYYNPINPEDYLNIHLSIDREKIAASANNYIKEYMWIIFPLIIVALIGAIYLSRLLTIPITRLTKYVNDIKLNNELPLIDGLGSDEIGLLGNSLNDMRETLFKKDIVLKNQKMALDSAAIVAETDHRGKITYFNQKLLDISGYSEEDLIGSDHRILNSGHHSRDFFKSLWDTIKSGNVWKGEIKNKAKDGSFYWVDTTIFPIMDKAGRVNKFIAIRFDITEKKRITLELKDSSENIQKAMEAKNHFFANMSHEIRTPLNGVLGFTQVLLDSDLSGENRENVQQIKNCSESLLTIINDILDVSKLEAGKLTIKKESVDLKAHVNSIVDMFRPVIDNNKIELLQDLEIDLPQFIESDSIRLRQVLVNLIGNAVKFTEHGYVKIEVKKTDDFQGNRFIEFHIHDSGKGIALKDQHKIFDAFEQSVHFRSGIEGTGLGLNICKKILELMDGKIWFESTEGKGTVFSFRIPLVEVIHQVANIKEEKPIFNLNPKLEYVVLVAEDNLINQKVIEKILQKIGSFQIVFASNGYEAVTKVQDVEFDLVLMDVRMPVMSGLEAAEKIRALPHIKQPYIIGLSANAFEEDIELGLSKGMDDYLAKPLDKNKLQNLLFKNLKKMKRAS